MPLPLLSLHHLHCPVSGGGASGGCILPGFCGYRDPSNNKYASKCYKNYLAVTQASCQSCMGALRTPEKFLCV